MSQTFSLDLQNVTNHKNVFSQTYDDRKQSINSTYQLGFFQMWCISCSFRKPNERKCINISSDTLRLTFKKNNK